VGASLHIALEGISKRFGKTVALTDVSLNFQGQVNLLLGPNGSGKTTLLNVLTGLTYPETGSLIIDDQKYEARHANWSKGVDRLRLISGVLADKPGLPSYLNGYELLASTARAAGCDLDKSWIQELIERLGMLSYIHLTIGGYSSGMSQKLALACSLVTKPRLVIWDEPTSNLDSKARAALLDLVRRMTANDTQFIISTHVSVDFGGVCDWLAIMNLGRIISSRKLSEYASTSDEFEAVTKDPKRLAISLIEKGIAASIISLLSQAVVFRASEEGFGRCSDVRTLSDATGCDIYGLKRVPKSVAEILEQSLRKEIGSDG
jgi:ABC-type multidrug transport system ATPase subunit